MEAFRPLVDLFTTLDDLVERVEPTWWGAVVADPRFPDVHDANYARIDGPRPDLTIDEVEAHLLPVLREIGAPNEHVAMFDVAGTRRLFDALETRGDRIGVDTVMELMDEPPDVPPHPVEEVDPADPHLWERQHLALAEFDVTEPEPLDQLVAWERDMLTPFGKRWFAVRVDGEMEAFGALLVQGDTGYVDNIVTMPPFRRRGLAAAVVVRIVDEARRGGARRTFLLADRPDPIRLYERLGFRRVGEVASSFRPLP
ncbi:MAG: GNAT family N-acetyltransferase [Actinobacteria bacterium]|nr:GNAT family N-acetyltransferase [Actinomycetota bacterium]